MKALQRQKSTDAKTKTAHTLRCGPFRFSTVEHGLFDTRARDLHRVNWALDATRVALPQPAPGFSTGNEHGYTVT
jgi:hypothetical protein